MRLNKGERTCEEGMRAERGVCSLTVGFERLPFGIPGLCDIDLEGCFRLGLIKDDYRTSCDGNRSITQ